jgi:DNA polymerase-3 subunit gamma/tau
VALSSEPGAPTLREQAQERERERKQGAATHPLVQAVLEKFPGSKIVDVRERAAAPDEAAPEAGLPDAVPDPDLDDDEF